MKVGVISDTHDNLPGVRKAVEIFSENKVQLILHCGDWLTPSTFAFLSDQAGKTI